MSHQISSNDSPVRVFKTIESARDGLRASHASGERIVLVPTMGALHAGHEALIRQAAQLAQGGPVVVSIFVNPLQFGPKEDFNRYPRDFDRDRSIAAAAGATDIFAPAAAEMTPEGMKVTVDPGELEKHLCGPFRPGHFRGVCTIVLKLFNVVQPTHAIFGWKDAQQFVILSKMVRDLNLPIEMVGGETVREADGLAMSSRNAYLSAEERAKAPGLYATLKEISEKLHSGGMRPGEVNAAARRALAARGIENVEYVELVSLDALAPMQELAAGGKHLLAGAVRIGNTRLIDNVRW